MTTCVRSAAVLADVLLCLGLALLVTGLALFSVVLALILAGVVMVGLSFAVTEQPKR